MYNSTILADRIKLMAKEQNIQLKAIWSEVGITDNTLTNLRKGSMLGADKVALIADYLNCSVDYLLGRTDNPSATGGTYIKNNNHNVNQAINGDVNINADTSEKDDKQLFDMIKGLDLVQRSETIVYINNLKKKEGE